MATIFEALSPEQRRIQQDAYLSYLKERDGLPNVVDCTLENREKVYDAYRADPQTWDGPVPTEEFWDLYDSNGRNATPDSTPLAAWMAILGRINAGEKYGVELGIQRYRTSEPDLDNPVTYLEMEEFYHTHMLADALKVLGIDLKIQNPTGITKWIVMMLAKLPKAFSFPFILIAETVAVLVFVELWKSAKKFFGTETPAARRIVWFLEQIILDEVGHVAFAQSKLGPVRLWIARQLIPLMGKEMMKDNPCIPLLYDIDAIAKTAQNFTFDDLPEELRAKAFIPLQASYRAAVVAAA